MIVRWILNLPGGGEDCIHFGVFVISRREQKYVLYKKERNRHGGIYFITLICTEEMFSHCVTADNVKSEFIRSTLGDDTQFTGPRLSPFIFKITYGAHQSACPLRLVRGSNTQVGFWGRWSIYWSDSLAHPHHSETQPQQKPVNIVQLSKMTKGNPINTLFALNHNLWSISGI